MQLLRRTFLAAVASAPTLAYPTLSRADASDGGVALGELDVREVRLEPSATRRSPGFGDAFVMATPTGLAPDARVPLVVLLHGLGETVDTRLGMHAWVDRYGLASAYARLRTVAEATRFGLARPLRGLAFACPYVPNIYKPRGSASTPPPGAVLEAYTRFVVDAVLPRARAEANVRNDVGATALAGCSLGGFMALELFLRRADAFGAVAGVQTAISEASATSYGERLARTLQAAGSRAILLETSTRDPFRAATTALSAALRSRTIAHDFSCMPGPHDQPWLRESGTPTLLAWLDTHLA